LDSFLGSAQVFGFVQTFLTNDKFDGMRRRMNLALLAKGMITIGSLFSGWGVLEMVLSELERQWNQLFPEIPFQAGQPTKDTTYMGFQ
jgi:hypothetical protein